MLVHKNQCLTEETQSRAFSDVLVVFTQQSHPRALGLWKLLQRSRSSSCRMSSWHHSTKYPLAWGDLKLPRTKRKGKNKMFSSKHNWPNPPDKAPFSLSVQCSLWWRCCCWILVFKPVLGTPQTPALVLGPVCCLCLLWATAQQRRNFLPSRIGLVSSVRVCESSCLLP